MKIAKALGIGTASAAGVGVTTYGSIELTSKIKRNNFLNEANDRAARIEKEWTGVFYALRSDAKDEEWEWLYLRKVRNDGEHRWSSNRSEYGSTYEKTKWEGEYWKRIINETTKIVGADFSKVKEIYGDDHKYNTKWKKFKEICLNWYSNWNDDERKGGSNDISETDGHACLYSDDEIPWKDLEAKYKSNTSQDPGNIYWERMKNSQSQPSR